MSVGEEIFPEGCLMAYMDNGKLSPTGTMFMEEQRISDWSGQGVEHPCYGCRVDDCGTRQVEYHYDMKKFIILPRSRGSDAALKTLLDMRD